MAWGSTNKTKLNQLLRHQKHASRLIFFKDKLTQAKPLLQSINALNISRVHIYVNFYIRIKSSFILLRYEKKPT